MKESPIASAIFQSTATKIYLPNSEAGNEGMREFYRYAGLNSREIEMLQTRNAEARLLRRSTPWPADDLIPSWPGRARVPGCLRPEGSGANQRLGREYGEGWISVWMSERKVERSWIDYYEGASDMKSRWLAKGTSAVAMVAVIATATDQPGPARAGVPGAVRDRIHAAPQLCRAGRPT